MQQDIDTRFRRLEADKFATAGYVQREKPSVIVAALQTDRRAGERTRVETPRDVRRVAVVPAS